jgi:serine/threonine protein kinase
MGTAPKAPKVTPPPAAIKPGDVVLDRYRVVEQIASGGHSVVFRGTDERLSRPVCIKLFSGLGGKSGVGRTSYEHFVQEAFALSRLTHPNTLRIYDFGHLGTKDEDGMPLQVCEFMNGGTLTNMVREQGPQPLAEMVRVIGAMCAALGEAHGLGIVHRDIKPQNILFGTVGGNRLPKLADFGIAKWSADEREPAKRAEDTAIVAGQKLAMYSPSWAAPEQLAGQPVSAATDIYSIAVVAIYMLTGKAIFAEEDVYAGYKKRRQSEQPIQEALSAVSAPRSLIALLSRALAFDPKKRLSKVEELAAELATVLEPSTEELPRLARITSRGMDAVAPAPFGYHQTTPTVPHSAVTPPAGTPTAPRPGPAKEPAAPPGPAPSAAPPPGPASPAAPSSPTSGGGGPGAAAAAPAASPPAAAAPPGGPLLPAVTPTLPPVAQPPKVWAPPVVCPPWMMVAGVPAGPPRRLPLSDVPHQIGDRNVHFVLVTNGVVDLIGSQAQKVRVTFLNAQGGVRVLHVKGMTCFVAHLGGRPSPAVQLDQPSDLALVTPRAQEIGHIRVATGSLENGMLVFPLGSARVAIGSDDCTDPILFDFGPGSEAYFVYTQGRAIPRSRRR